MQTCCADTAADARPSFSWTVSSLSNIVQRLGRSSYDVSGGKELANSSFKLQYVDQSGATGKVYVDTVALGDLVIKEQAIEASDSASANMWFRRDYDGIIGFGFSQRNEVKPKKVKTFFDNILPSLSLPLFAVDLRGPGKASSMDIGKIDSTKYSGELVYTAADSSLASWTIVIGGYAIDGDVQKAPFSAIVDTGSALMALPATIAVAYHRAIRSAKWNIPAARWSVDCDATLPDLSLIIGDQLRTMPGSLLKTESSPGSCQSAITPVGQFGEDSPSIGNIFMRSQYIVFASKDEQYWVGFGQKVGSVHTLTQDPGAAAPTSAP